MKKGFLYILLFLTNFGLQAQTPDAISYQGLVRDAGNAVVANGIVSVRISIIKTLATGSVVYVETHNAATDGNGIFSIQIGQGSTSNNFAAIDWAADKHFLKREIDPAGGSNYTISGTTQFLSVPYALNANTTESVLLENGKVLVGNSTGKSAGVLPSGDMTISSTGVATFTTEAVGSAEIVDNSFTASDLSTGSVASDEIADGAIINNHLNKANIPLSGFAVTAVDINANSQQLSNIQDPVNSQDAATKAYVDALEVQLDALISALKESRTLPVEIGDFVFGGVVAYILQSGDPGYDANAQHGIVVAATNQSTSAAWGCYGTTITGADGTALGTGMQNTLDIVTGCATAGIASRLCNDLSLNGYTDWYLPSKDELNKLYLNKSTINATAVAIGGTAINGGYWSSTEIVDTDAWYQGFNDGSQSYDYKYEEFTVRAIRAF